MKNRLINSILVAMLSVVAAGSACGARPGTPAVTRQSETDSNPTKPTAPSIPPPPPKEQSEGDACRAAWYLSHDVTEAGDPFAILGPAPGTWAIDADVDGRQVQLVPTEFAEYQVNIVRKEQAWATVHCKVPVAWKAHVLAVDVMVPAIVQDLEQTEYGRPVKARAGVVYRPVSVPGNSVISVELAWFLHLWTVTQAFENSVRSALRIGLPFAIDFESNPTGVEDPERPGLAVGFSDSADPSTVHSWGVLSEDVRNAAQGRRQKTTAFIPFGVLPDAAEGMSEAKQLFETFPTYNLQNLVLWDASRRGRVPCRQAGGRWEERCGNIFPLFVKSAVLDVSAEKNLFAHVVWRAREDWLLLTTLRLEGKEVVVEKTLTVEDLTELGLAPVATLKSLQWP